MTTNEDFAIRAEGLSQSYGSGRAIFDALDLSVGLGELVAIAGPNGVGKSTLLRTLLGILRAKEGTVTLFGREVSALERSEIAPRAGEENSG